VIDIGPDSLGRSDKLPVVYYKKVLGVVRNWVGSLGIACVKNQRRSRGANAIVSRCLRGRIEEENIG
jgi:hypothetical protein